VQQIQAVKFPPLSLNIPVFDSIIVNGQWQVPGSALGHLNTSANPGQNGNIVIYGHNKPGLLSKLGNLKVSDQINIVTAMGTEATYIITSISVVSPSDIEIAQDTQVETLTIYTCTGPLDSQRLVVRAIPFRI
jgi:LPXTG-site transpeptidase (sortase) family protein